MFNSVTDPTRVALVGAVWNSTLSDKSLLQVRCELRLLFPKGEAF